MVDARGPIQARAKGAPLTIGEKLTLHAVAALLATEDIGVVLVERANSLRGIPSERDARHQTIAGLCRGLTVEHETEKRSLYAEAVSCAPTSCRAIPSAQVSMSRHSRWSQ